MRSVKNRARREDDTTSNHATTNGVIRVHLPTPERSIFSLDLMSDRFIEALPVSIIQRSSDSPTFQRG